MHVKKKRMNLGDGYLDVSLNEWYIGFDRKAEREWLYEEFANIIIWEQNVDAFIKCGNWGKIGLIFLCVEYFSFFQSTIWINWKINDTIWVKFRIDSNSQKFYFKFWFFGTSFFSTYFWIFLIKPYQWDKLSLNFWYLEELILCSSHKYV